ncbi:MAG: hypothetical protein MJE77_26875 [Proteobacteria bacterium]|nr:hypothetical protein [Pseudomonadota bacterium]
MAALQRGLAKVTAAASVAERTPSLSALSTGKIGSATATRVTFSLWAGETQKPSVQGRLGMHLGVEHDLHLQSWAVPFTNGEVSTRLWYFGRWASRLYSRFQE